jgi:hypothetical protein
MEPLLIILVPGLFGGLILALLLYQWSASRRHAVRSIVVSRRLAAPSPSLINMANIKVEGVGGLGMLAAVVAVAVTDPRVRLAMIVAAGLGVGLALVLIAIRRRTGALPSTGDGPEDRSMLHLGIEGPERAERRRTSRAGVRATIEHLQRAETC